MSIENVLNQRQETHGDFKHDAFVSQTVKNVFYNVQGDHGKGDLSDGMRQSIDMIASKLGRIAAGNCEEVDHWVDIAGYATLGAKECPFYQAEPTKFLLMRDVPRQVVDTIYVLLGTRYIVDGSYLSAEPSKDVEGEYFDIYAVHGAPTNWFDPLVRQHDTATVAGKNRQAKFEAGLI